MMLKTILFVHCVIAMDPTTKDLLTPIKQYGESCGYEACPNPKKGMINVHIVPHTHAELGHYRTFDEHYTGKDDFHPQSNVNMKRILDATIAQLWANKERKFTLSDSEMPYFFHWWSKRDGTVHRMVYQLLRQGRLFFVGGGWGMSDEACTSYQGIIDSFTYNLRKLNNSFLDCGRPLVAWQADTFGHSREFASLMAMMGYDGVFINPISFDDELYRMRNKSLEFLWRGSDDLGHETDIFTHKLFDGYWSPPGFCFGSMCPDPILITSDSIFNNVAERVQRFIESIQYRQAPHYRSQHVMVMMGQRLGYHDAELWFTNIDKLIDGVNMRSHETSSGIHLYYSTPACYLKAVHYSNPVLQTKQDDFFPFAYDKHSYMTGMYTSRPTLKYMVREGNIYLQMAKQIQVLARMGNNDKLFEEINWIMGVLQDHNVITGALRIYVKQYYSKKIYDAIQSTTVFLRRAFNKLRKSNTRVYYRCSFNISSCQNTDQPRSFIVIYNPLGWPVTMPVRLPVSRGEYIVHDPKGKTVKSAIMKIPSPVLEIPERSTADHELVFIAENLPPLGLRSYYIERAARRIKKSLIKKLKKNKKTKYYIRQANPFIIDNKTFFADDDEYDDIHITTENTVQVGNIPDEVTKEKNYDYIVTPKPRKVTEVTNTVELTTEEVYGFYPNRKMVETSKDYDDSEASSTTEYVIYTNTPTHTPEHVTRTRKVITDLAATEEEEITTETTAVETDFRKYAKFHEESKDFYIENKYIKISIDKSTRKVASVLLSNGVNTSLDIQFYYYASDDPGKMKTDKRPPGPYIFRAMDITPEPIIDEVDTKVYKSDVVSEIHCKYSNYASFAVKLYEESPVIEVDWVAGPIPVDDGVGKDVFIRYTTDLINDGVFYTDANGRQTVKRIRHTRASYELLNLDPIAGNIYPVTSRIYIEDKTKNLRLSIFNDRPQGGTSLFDGMIDLFVHRRILTDDNSIQAILNETFNDKGIVVRGKHYIYLRKSDFKPNRVFEKKFAKEIELTPQIFANGVEPIEREKWLKYNNEVFALKNKLPVGVHLLTLEAWNEGTILIRLENYLEKADVVRTGVKRVFLKDLFLNIVIDKVKETTLAANIWLEDFTPLQWNKSSEFVKNFNDYYGDVTKVEYSKDEGLRPVQDVVLEEGITLTPQQIRTFVAWFHFIDKDA